jgi:ribosomal protein L40E/DNA-binding FrmR family transcriptional regulator
MLSSLCDLGDYCPGMATQPPRICDRCGAENTPRAKACTICGGTRFAPKWVRQLRRVNKQFAVQVTDPHPDSGAKEPRLTLSKWWPGGSRSFNINGRAQWAAVRRAVDELSPYLKWSTKSEIAEALKEQEKDSKALDKQLHRVTTDDPTILSRIVEGIDFRKVSEEDLPEVARQISSVAQALVGAERGMRLAIEQVVKRLPKQGKKATESLAELMDQLTLRQITAVTAEVQRRMELLAAFKSRMLDDRTYEIRGDNSIHRLLEGAMWLVDERYWLMHSNEALRTIVGRQLARADKKFERQRPDFVCGTVDRKLIIIEIKRPSHLLTVDDLNQLERYVTICEENSKDFSSLEAAVLVGRRTNSALDRTLKHRSGRFKVRTYTDLLHDTELRYKKLSRRHDRLKSTRYAPARASEPGGPVSDRGRARPGLVPNRIHIRGAPHPRQRVRASEPP